MGNKNLKQKRAQIKVGIYNNTIKIFTFLILFRIRAPKNRDYK